MLSHDWKTLYVPIESKKVTTSEKDGKVIQRLEYSGRIGVWDIATGQEAAPPSAYHRGIAPFYAVLSPDGRDLLTSERQSFSVGETRRGRRLELGPANRSPAEGVGRNGLSTFHSRWENGLLHRGRLGGRIYTLKLLDFATGKELASFPCPDKDVIMLGGEFSPDGSILMATMSPLKGGWPTILFLEGKTLAERGRFACPCAPAWYVLGQFQVHARWQVVPDPRCSRDRPHLGPGFPEGSPVN